MSRPDILVVGSINQDLVVRVDRLPQPGETLLGQQQPPTPGGKGANQAVAAAKLGASTVMVGAVGDDEAGDTLRARLSDADVDTHRILVREGVPTGTAFILVDAAGENVIVVAPGANASIHADTIAALSAPVTEAAVTLLQLEIPLDAVTAAARVASGTVLLNPAPAHPDAADLLPEMDVVVPNEHELLSLVGRPDVAPSRVEIERAARQLSGQLACVVTLGAEGALVAQGGHLHHVPSFAARVVDTTGAGDAFCAGLADALARGANLLDAARRGCAVGALAVGGSGAQGALPSFEQVEALLSVRMT